MFCDLSCPLSRDIYGKTGRFAGGEVNMINIDALKNYGANVEVLKENIEANDLGSAFEAAHALKGITGNLALTPLYEPIVEITELLRARTETDYSPLLSVILTKRKELEDLMN